MTLDERTRSALARLTESEKECLRRRLLPQTAKEMAIDLGVSPHAIEKRLKMARTKLGVGSSLEVARMLAALEGGYGRMVPEKPDLDRDAIPGDARPRAAWTGQRLALAITGIASMSLILATLALLAPQTAPGKANFEEATAFLEASFTRGDRDKSGFLDATDTPKVAIQGPGDTEPRAIEGSYATTLWMGKLDTNGDGKVSREEYVSRLRPGVMERGIPVPPKG